jgi:isoquinoline 1-oxidoreductase subunit alpha
MTRKIIPADGYQSSFLAPIESRPRIAPMGQRGPGAACVTRCRGPASFLETLVIKLSVNGKALSIDADADMPLLWALREQLQLTGTKFGCGMALCGACTVHLDGRPIRSCTTPISAAAGRRVTTIEGIGSTRTGKAVQAAWISHDVPQCGYCQSGQIMSACALLADKKQPTDAEIDTAMSGNLCRCGTYNQIRAAIKDASVTLAKGA